MVRSTKLLTMLWLCLAACGCAQAPVAPLAVPAVSIWLDDAFELPPGSAQPGGDDLFALEPALLDRLNEAVAAAPTAQGRLDTLISLIYDAPQRPFSYAYHSTVARVTWQARRGDCLSLTVMAYALARALGLQAHMQEVSVPVSFDRRDGVDFVAGHINLYIQESDAGGLDTRRPSQHGVVIDFEPQVGSPRIGTKLSADQVKARYFNNLGADHLAQGDAKRAYAFLKAAIQTDSRFSPPYSNLALIYQRHGHPAPAEALLRLATALPSDDGVAMAALETLLTAQGRLDEAEAYTRLLGARRERNPYHWIGLGVAEMRAEHWSAAVKALEHAQALSSGFAEVHRNLAVAYARVGESAKAEAQLAKLDSLSPNDPGYAALTAKVRRLSGL